MSKKIPKIIHYAWFGGNEKPEMVQECINSWKRHMPEWEIKEWNEHNFDLSKYPFALEAHKRKRYAFVTDVVRLAVLHEYGGVYCDSDVYAVKSFNKFTRHRAFTGHETKDLMVTATMGAEKGHPWIEKLLGFYEGREYNEETNTNIITSISRGLMIKEDKYGFKYLKDDVVIYPVFTFCSFNHQVLEPIPHPDAYAYHLFLGSWTGRDIRKIKELENL
jgi:Mannosyltransferase OCH1 and related enzymes